VHGPRTSAKTAAAARVRALTYPGPTYAENQYATYPPGHLVTYAIGALVVIRLYGEHDLSTTERLSSEVAAAIANARRAIVDLSVTTFIDASVLRVLVQGRDTADRTNDRLFAVIAPPGSIARRLVDLTNLGQSVAVFDDEPAAIETSMLTAGPPPIAQTAPHMSSHRTPSCSVIDPKQESGTRRLSTAAFRADPSR
jgi:anti-sigma B factor antagonist